LLISLSLLERDAERGISLSLKGERARVRG
jgi:hypothetical protein